MHSRKLVNAEGVIKCLFLIIKLYYVSILSYSAQIIALVLYPPTKEISGIYLTTHASNARMGDHALSSRTHVRV